MTVRWKFGTGYIVFVFSLMVVFVWRSYPESTVKRRITKEGTAYHYPDDLRLRAVDDSSDKSWIESSFYDSYQGDYETANGSISKEDRDDNRIWNEWEQIQNKRREAIQEACGGNLEEEDKYTNLLVSRGSIGHLLVDDVHKAIYCFIPKVGCTTWEKMWMILTGISNAKDVSEIEDNTPHTIIGKMMLFGQDLSDEELRHKLETYMKVIVVRHPFQRLLSGYFDKVSSEHGKLPYQKLVLSHVKQYRTNANITNIAWHEYVNFVNSLSRLRDSHWQSYENLCHPCEVDYDIVVQFDTFAEDSEMFLRLIKAPSDLHFPNEISRVDSSVMDHYMKQLTDEQVNRLYNYFRRDFELFQYNM